MAAAQAGARFRIGAGKTPGGAGIDDLFGLGTQIFGHLLAVAHQALVGPDGEVAVAHDRLAAFGGAAFRDPFGEAAIEDRDFMGAEQRQHPPDAGGGTQRRIVIDDDAAAISQAERLHAAGEFFRRWQHVRQRRGRVRHFIDVEEHGARDMGRFEFGASVTAVLGQEQRRIDDTNVGLAQFGGEPFGGHKRVHCSLPYLRCA